MTIKHIVLSGGGPNGLSQFGALKKFIEEGIIQLNNIESIFATSIGTVIAILLSIGVEVIDIEEYLIKKNWSKSFLNNTNDILNLDKEKGIINHNFIKEIMECFYKSKDIDSNINFKDLYKISNISLHFYAIKLNDYSLIEFSCKTTPEMPVLMASIASCSLPPIFGPILYKDDYYIDGGFFNNYPINSCLDINKCKHEEIMGIRISARLILKYNNIEKDNFTKYLFKISTDLIAKNMTDDHQIDISNNLVINSEFETGDIELWDNFANNKEFREKLINEGYDLANEFKQKIQQTP